MDLRNQARARERGGAARRLEQRGVGWPAVGSAARRERRSITDNPIQPRASSLSPSLARARTSGFRENFGSEWMQKFLCFGVRRKPFQRNWELESFVPNGT